MSLADIILERFKDFMRGQPEPYKFLQVFYTQEKERFLNDKMNDYMKQNKSKEEASILARQGFVSAVGRALEKIIELYWKLKLLQSPVTSHIKVFMITPDNDDEISFKDKPKKALSWNMNEMAFI
nr:BsaWI family type II restriction enzyme [Helicobacter pylori]